MNAEDAYIDHIHGARVEVVRISTVIPEGDTSVYYGLAANGRYGASILRLAQSMEELRELVGCELDDQRSLWDFVARCDPMIGTWDGERIDPLDEFLGGA